MLHYDLTAYPYPSSRRVVMGQRGAVATSQPLASLAGMEMLLAGGNAVDAALAMAIALTVVEPTSNGIGGDAFALVWDGKLHGLNASGRSPQAMTLEQFAGMDRIPPRHWLSVTVPGAVSAWQALWQRWGKLPFERLFEPAIRYAADGFPVSPETALLWKQAESSFLPLDRPEFQPFKQVFLRHDRAPAAGEVWHSSTHAETLREIARTQGESFYRGALAERIANFAAATGGLLTLEDLATHTADWVDPISTNYRGFDVWEIPPNGQGIATLIALNILEGIDLSRFPHQSPERYHYQIEAMKLAFADLHQQIADPGWMQIGLHQLLDKGYASDRRQLISATAIPLAEPGLSPGGTVYLAAADADLMVSFIQSNYLGFGSGILVPGSGIALHNRATGFTLATGHPNQVAPGKRSFHTIIPGFLSQAGRPIGPFGVMGGFMQPQGHLQVVSNLVDYSLNPQSALDAPRWQFVRDNLVLLEATVPEQVKTALINWEHQTQTGRFFGRGQTILRDKGILIAASEPRADGLALVW